MQVVLLTPESAVGEGIRERAEGSVELLRDESYIEQEAESRPEITKPGKQKTGRKPRPLTCFLCSTVLPYKCQLISHLRTVHAISRSLSLMYKRINQGGEEIRRLYCPRTAEKGPRRQRNDS